MSSTYSIVMQARTETIVLFLVSFLGSAAITLLLKRSAARQGLVDVPNQRSSHEAPTPRGGGLSFVIITTLASVLSWRTGQMSSSLVLVLVCGGLAIAAVGYMDDRLSLPVKVRLPVHFGAAILAVYLIGGVPSIRLGDMTIALGLLGDVLAVLAVVWMLNLFNFMDGIDGLAASEAVFVAVAGIAFCWPAGSGHQVLHFVLAFVGAVSGFLLFNWPRAKIFMGDVGSGYLGYVLSVCCLVFIQEDPGMLVIWLILAAVFLVDATFTLLRRMLSRKSAFEPHRSHAYQRLATRWKSHGRVTLSVLSFNILVLLPAALIARTWSRSSWLVLATVLIVLSLIAVRAGAGREEPH